MAIKRLTAHGPLALAKPIDDIATGQVMAQFDGHFCTGINDRGLIFLRRLHRSPDRRSSSPTDLDQGMFGGADRQWIVLGLCVGTPLRTR